MHTLAYFLRLYKTLLFTEEYRLYNTKKSPRDFLTKNKLGKLLSVFSSLLPTSPLRCMNKEEIFYREGGEALEQISQEKGRHPWKHSRSGWTGL